MIKQTKSRVKGAPPWMTTYGDMITQVLVFFILLFSLSDINVLKFSSFFTKMKKPPVILDEEQLRRVMVELADLSKREGLGDLIGMEIDERGLKISLTESLMFRSGEARILPEALPVLDKIAEMLESLPNEMMIEGHTDNIPIRTKQFPSNWELSMARAVNMLKYLVEVQEIDASRVSAAGYGEYRPVATNETPEGRAQNRRVVLVVLRQRMELKNTSSQEETSDQKSGKEEQAAPAAGSQDVFLPEAEKITEEKENAVGAQNETESITGTEEVQEQEVKNE